MAISVNLKVLESTHYFWVATKAREKVGEQYVNSIAVMPEMKPLYSNDFSEESVRKLLSGISNREMFPWNQKEGRFWNNNMWIFEEWSLMESIVAKVKVLNLSELESIAGDLEVVVIPGHIEPAYKSQGKLTLNYFKFNVTESGELTFDGIPVKEYIKGQL